MAKTFLNLTPKECEETYPSLVANGNIHFTIANLLGEKEYYGSAISHLILGAEELTKALVIFFDSLGFSLRQKQGVNKLFKDHKSRHQLNSVIQGMSLIIGPILEILRKEKAPELTDKELSKIGIQKPDQLLLTIDGKTFDSILETLSIQSTVDYSSISHFWNNADNSKQNGFYVEYQDKLIEPIKISKSDFSSTLVITNKFRVDSNELINHVNCMNPRVKKAFINIFLGKEFKKLLDRFFNNLHKKSQH
jgi:AbiV family abortive infection protein